jgi:peptidyl-prolyl cis-trans isomerase SurA
VGAKAGQRDGSAGKQRLALFLFGGLLALLFIGFAVTEGIGSPSVPSGNVAIVEDVPGDLGRVSQEDFDRTLAQQVAQAKLKETPEPGSDKFEELKEAALGELLDQIWILGEAEDLGLQVTDKQVEDELATIKKQQFGSEQAYQKFLKESKFTEEDVDDRVRLQLLSSQIQQAISNSAPKPSAEEIEAYYEAEKEKQFTTKESRDVRTVINKDKAKVEAAKRLLEKDSSPAGWKKAAAQYSIDPTSKSKGGLQQGISEEFVKGPLKTAIFDSPTGQLTGPVKFESNYILVEVVKLNPQKIQTLPESKAQIESTLGQEKQQEFFSEFVTNFQTKWQQRTYCAEDYLVASRCANATGDGRPSNAPSACYEEDPATPAEACPSPVTPTSPALPGSVTEQKPEGKPFQQRPLPESTPEQGEEVPAGAPPGAAPSGE